MTLSGTATVYYVVAAINSGVESLSGAGAGSGAISDVVKLTVAVA
jgi:hypothetical protein